MSPQIFQELVWDYYQNAGRDLPWRHQPLDGYHVLVSEFMLQQTQVNRVVPKYVEFIKQFPDVEALSQASLADVLRAWSGLGYNRRAKYLHQASHHLLVKPEPWSVSDLIACKGIGNNTAAAVVTYAYNKPIAFIETNIRTVYIYHFFPDRDDVSDKELLPIIESTIDQDHPREFMWAVMDYGSYLKASVGNLSRYSKHHSMQSKFEGSRRQIRGSVLKALHENELTTTQLRVIINDYRLKSVLNELESERLIQRPANKYRLSI